MDPLWKNPAFDHLLARLGGEGLSFSHPVEDPKLLQTHISLVLLAGDYAYKIKKQVKFPFVDYSTLDQRLNFCRMEVGLNRRLAGNVYLGVVPITRRDGILYMEGEGEAVEYAVKMRRLPDEGRLGNLLEKGSLPGDFWKKLTDRLARFYREGARGPEVSVWAGTEAVEEDWKQIFEQAPGISSHILDPGVRDRLKELAMEGLRSRKRRIEVRAAEARDGHGDLRLEHIYFFPGKEGEDQLSIIDCVEFNPRYRCCDPLADAAFLAMDLEAAGFQAESRIFKESFLRGEGGEGENLLEFYVAYRHLVRGLIRALQYRDKDQTPGERMAARDKARLHFLSALGKLEKPGQKPCLVMLCGLPGSGKSSLARLMEKEEGFRVISSDAVRKELAGLPLASKPGEGFRLGIYSLEWTEKTFTEMRKRAESSLLKGQKVLVDATFTRHSAREPFWELAGNLGVPFSLFICEGNRETARERLSRADRYGSDADLKVYEEMEKTWEAPAPRLGAHILNANQPLPANLAEIRSVLRDKDLADALPPS